ncbi:ribosomal large subunit pseudouridine synthase D [Gracilibacillus ureilyticus]|uniref:Pseudouridine synthase n=1 Tax=Gracilibacillus ureilyticus TaxID=531814 RepID=A0A1H9KZQ2_9BACI|nr:RluA family pseudouridine synthase [Gracilibacillus ureilyticus]SER04538.1 ribosomal large subunit pseudouridine synthase D [Gracilibacillus ureilyticus]
MSLKQYKVQQEDKGIRIDKLLVDITEDYSRSQIKTWFDQKIIKVNGKSVKQNYKCQPDDLIEWEVPEVEPLEVEARDIPINIVYEDQDILVVNKASGMVVHPSAGHQDDTLVNALLYHCDDLSGINGVARPGIVHRIDKDTSGLLVVAKNDKAHEQLAEQMKDKQIKREYKALVHGDIPHEYGTIDAPVGRSEKNRQLMDVVENGKPAITHFEVIERLHGKYTFIKCVLDTGRTHQIRVHMKYIGFPIVGDPKYGQRKSIDVEGQALHAYHLTFRHPITGNELSFDAELPTKFEKVLENIRKSY